MAQPEVAHTPAEQEEREQAHALVYWLQQMAEQDRRFLPALRRSTPIHASPQTWGIALGSWTVFQRADEVGRGEVYRGVARLFAIYHQGPQGFFKRGHGSGSMGKALARLEHISNPYDPKRQQLRMAALLRSRTRLPWRPLEQAILDMRNRRAMPPHWSELIIDLTHWYDRAQGASRAPTVGERWWSDYYELSPRP
ncbi:type I-E CRISPR-associated protein Cse2/CasB [Streptomyces roseolus]|uniref:type I-E CRISPR-associated protein Cse2/CasB n=1 Tax=Streptomyces roseolus TaxID=67358 RepID=UPI00378D7C5C